MYLIVQADEPDDYVIATGESHSVREFCELALRPRGSGLRTRARRRALPPPRRHHRDPRRRDEGAERAWLGAAVTFDELVAMMVDAEVERAKAVCDARVIADVD